MSEAPTDRIRLTGISATGHHGVFEHERRDGQRFVADVVLHVDTRQAAAGDDLAHTVDYGGLAGQVHGVLSGEPADLVETVAERIAAVALAHPAVQAVDVVVHKPDAPITVPFLDVAVEVHRSRTHPPVVVAPGQAAPGQAAPGQAAPAAPVVAPVPALDGVQDEPSRPDGPYRLDGPGVPDEAYPQVDPYGVEAEAPAPASPAPWEALFAADEPVGALPPADVSEVALPVPAAPPAPAVPGLPAGPQPAPVIVAGAGAVVGPPTAALPLGELPWAADDVLTPADPLVAGAPVDRLDEPPAAPAEVVLALGSNLGSSQDILRAAVEELAALPGFEVTKVAPLARTAAVGGPDQPDFLNTVVLGRTVLSPRALLRACHEIEAAFGRERNERWGARTLDIDIVVFGSTLAVADDLELPHPRAHQRAFVLEPWAQVAPDAVLPGLGGGPVAALATTAPDREGIRWLALDWWAVPEE